MNRYQLLFATPDLSVSRFDHPPHEAHDDPDEEVSTRWAIAFVESGRFEVAQDGRQVRLGPGSVFLSQPGFRFCCRHRDTYPDDVCLSIGFAPGAVADSEHAWARAGWAVRRSATPRLAYVGRRIREAAAAGDPFRLEQWALAAMAALEADAGDGEVRGHYAARGYALDAVVTTCRNIEMDPAARRSIAERARDVGLNSARLTRAFRRYVGWAPHAYVVRCRLTAATALLDTGVSVSETCFRSGFENLSHFCRTFRQTLGVRASSWRGAGGDEKRRRLRQLTTRGW